MKKKVLKIYPSVYLLIGVIVSLMTGPIFNIVIGHCVLTSEEPFSIFYIICILLMFLIGFSMPFLVLFSEMKQWLERLHISADGIEIHAPFRKTKKFSYDDYSKIYYGYMTVRGIQEWFIIISSRTLSRFELTNLHKVEKTDAYVTVKYSEKRRKQLQEILPPKLSVQLKNPPPKQR